MISGSRSIAKLKEFNIAIETINAATVDDALEVGRSVARSNLFKCAIFGKDPNWGRILASVGTTRAAFDPADLDVALNGVWVCRTSGPGESPDSIDLTDRSVTVTIDLKSGDESGTIPPTPTTPESNPEPPLEPKSQYGGLSGAGIWPARHRELVGAWAKTLEEHDRERSDD